MGKKLSEMSLEELWQLFPIILTKHQEDWKEWYLEEEKLLKNILPQVEKISHIGSTAIPAIWAKPIIDILVEVPKESNLLDYKQWNQISLVDNCCTSGLHSNADSGASQFRSLGSDDT